VAVKYFPTELAKREASHGYLALGCAAVFVLVLASAVAGTNIIESSFMKWLNSFAARSAFLDHSIYALTYVLFSGAILIAFMWYCWFASDRTEDRSLLLVGSFLIFVAGAVSRILQVTLPTHLRPLHDPALAFRPPLGVDSTILNRWNSFPSDHAAVYFGLALTVWLVRPRVGYVVFAVVLVLNLARVYVGVHYPTDVIGGGALGLFIVAALSRAPLLLSIADRLVSYERRAPAYFYAFAFLVSNGMASLFDDLRSVIKGLLLVLHGDI
jgi:membrane-associated phospholipid phosphatase